MGMGGSPATISTTVEQDKVTNIELTGSSYGAGIPIVYGCARIPCNLIWQSDIRESTNSVTSSTTSGGKGGGGGVTQETTTVYYHYHADFAVMGGYGPVVGVRKIWMDKQIVYNRAEDADSTFTEKTERTASTLTVHLGTTPQSQDSSMSTALGIANTPAYNGKVLLSFANLEVTQSGARIPAIEAEICQVGTVGVSSITRGTISAASVIQDLCVRAGLTLSDIDTTALTAELSGFVVSTGSYRDAIEQLLEAFSLGACSSGSKIRFYPLDAASVATIDITELNATQGGDTGDGVQPLLGINRKKETDLPRKVQVVYRDIARDHQEGMQPAQRHVTTTVVELKRDFDISMTSNDAQRIANRILYRKWTERTEYDFTLPIRYLRLEPGDVITINDSATGASYSMRLTRVDIGANFLMRCRAVAHDAAVYTQTATGASGDGGVITLRYLGNTTAYLLNLPALKEDEADFPYVYLAATGDSNGWRGAAAQLSFDNEQTWEVVATVPAKCVIGETLSALPTDGNALTWNTRTQDYVDVELINSEFTLTSNTDDAILNGANLALVNNELIQFGTATLIAANTFRLSRLLRGRRGTELSIPDGATGSRFVLINSTLGRASLPLSRYFSVPRLRIVPIGGDETLAAITNFSVFARNLWPYSPCDFAGSRDGSGNLTMTWKRRSRQGQELMSGTDIPLGESIEKYEIHIYTSNARTTRVRVIEATTQTATYTSAQQVADFGSNQATVYVRAYQISGLIGLSGNYRDANL